MDRPHKKAINTRFAMTLDGTFKSIVNRRSSSADCHHLRVRNFIQIFGIKMRRPLAKLVMTQGVATYVVDQE